MLVELSLQPEIPQIAIDFLKLHEACVLRIYDDVNPHKAELL